MSVNKKPPPLGGGFLLKSSKARVGEYHAKYDKNGDYRPNPLNNALGTLRK